MLHIKYFAIFQEEANKQNEDIEFVESESWSVQHVYQKLRDQYQFSLSLDQIRIAINHEFSSQETQLNPGDTVAFIPPVSGG